MFKGFIGVEILQLHYKMVWEEWGFTIVNCLQVLPNKGEERDKEKMGLKLNITATSLLLLLASAAKVSGDINFDVTKYGARADGNSDISQARTIQL